MYTAIIFVLLAVAALIFLNGLKSKNRIKIFFGLLIAVLTLGFFSFMGFWGEALWFDALGFKDRFWLEITYSIVYAIVGAVVAFGSLYLLTIFLPKSSKYVKWIAVIIGTFLGGTWGYTNWDVVMKFWDKVPPTMFDPIFGMSIEFYLFTLPLLDALYVLLFTITFLALAASVIAAFVRLSPVGLAFYLPPYGSESTKKLHTSLYLNSSIFLLVLAFGKFLDKYHLMYSSSGVVYGPGWSDTHILIPAYNIIIVFMILASILIIIPYLRNW